MRQLRRRIEELNAQAHLDRIKQLTVEVKEKEKLSQDLAGEIDQLRREQSGIKNDDAELEEARVACTEKLRLYRQVLNDKGLLYDEMFSMAKQLLHRDQLIVKNEQEIIRIKFEIEISKLELEQKKELVEELENDLADKKAEYKALKHEIR